MAENPEELKKERQFEHDQAAKLKELMEMSRRVAHYLQRNFHPHTTVIIEVDSIRVEETLSANAIEYALD